MPSSTSSSQINSFLTAEDLRNRGTDDDQIAKNNMDGKSSTSSLLHFSQTEKLIAKAACYGIAVAVLIFVIYRF